ncbi:hypothetical protein AAE478_009700 [Parahypoxylon ruwenzoriense]
MERGDMCNMPSSLPNCHPSLNGEPARSLLVSYMEWVDPASRKPIQTVKRTTEPETAPLLRRDRTNHVIVYNGCFNPPHRGHLANLRHAYQHSGGDMNVVGAIVLVAPDAYLAWKMGPDYSDPRDHEAPLRLAEAQRVRLWRAGLAELGAGEEHWCFVLPESGWVRASQKLEAALAEARFCVEFVRLAGGDKVSVAYQQHGVWGATTVTTDISRPLDFYAGGGSGSGDPVRLNNHGPWRRVVQEQAEKKKEGEALPAGDEQSEDASTQDQAPAAAVVEGSRNVWICEPSNSRNANLRIRFISSAAHERLDPELSSTNARRIIAGVDTSAPPAQQYAQLESRLRGVALGAGLLARYIVERRYGGNVDIGL